MHLKLKMASGTTARNHPFYFFCLLTGPQDISTDSKQTGKGKQNEFGGLGIHR